MQFSGRRLTPVALQQSMQKHFRIINMKVADKKIAATIINPIRKSLIMNMWSVPRCHRDQRATSPHME